MPSSKKTHFNAVMTEGRDQNARTPRVVYDLLENLFGVTRWYDPCPPDPRQDGLSLARWKKWNYVNPPFRDAREWIQKALEQRDAHGSRSVLLLGARTATRYFHDAVFPEAAAIVFLLNAVRFEGYKTRLGVPLMLVAIGTPPPRYPPGAATVLPCAALECGSGRIESDVLPRLRDLYGGFDTEVLTSKDPAGLRLTCKRRLVVVMAKPLYHVQRILADVARRPDALTVALLPARYSDSFVRRYVIPNAKHIVFLRPLVRFKTFRSSVATFAVAFGRAPDLPAARPCAFLQNT
jgi:hypothetical protein